jgi:hypothetical protein
MKKPTPRTTPTHAHRGALGGRATSRTKIAAARANGRKGGRPAIGGVYACRWPDGDITLVFARNKTAAMARLDEVGNPDGLEIRPLNDMVIALKLTDAGRLELDHDTDWGAALNASGRDGDLGEVEYPILTKARERIDEETDGAVDEKYTPQQRALIAAAVARERKRVKRGNAPKASTPSIQQFAEREDIPVALAEQIAAQVEREKGAAR